MKTFTYVIRDRDGIHARPAGIVIAEAKKYVCNLTITNKGRTVDLKRIFALMGLCIKCGETIEVKAEGPDEEAAIAAVEAAFKGNL